jgi:predicted dehydrogenase
MAKLQDATLVAVHDTQEEFATQSTRVHGGVVHKSLDDLLADSAVDVVYIALTHDLLAPTAQHALAAGKHVLVEKPMALDEDSLEALRRSATERGLVLGVNFELRETGAVRESRRLIHAGAIGDVRAVRIRTVIDKLESYWSSGPQGTVATGWRSQRTSAGCGVVLMNSIHQLDLVRHIPGLSFVRAIAEIATFSAQVEVEDYTAAVLRLSNGAVANLVAAAHSPGARREELISIDGAQGRMDLPDPYRPGRVRLYLRRPWEGLEARHWHEVVPPVANGRLELLRHFLQAVRTGGTPPAGAGDAAAALATVLAIYRSAASGEAVPIGRQTA